MIECNADLGHPCDADDGEPCPQCKASAEVWRQEWEKASPAERNPRQYRQDMIDAGRGHLLPEEE
jgi:hypothetical protein